jgi:predicted acylesterase/phospholipase RssA
MIHPSHAHQGFSHLNIMIKPEKYESCMLLSGGGFRYAYYLGMYAAFNDRNQAPSLLLATCGGAVAAAIIQGLPDDAQRKQWVRSPHMHQFWRELKSNPRYGITRAAWQAAKRKMLAPHAQIIPDLFNDYLFEIEQYVPLPAFNRDPSAIAVAIVAGKLRYSETEVGQPRHSRKLFHEIVFCDPRTHALLSNTASALANADNALDTEILVDTQMPIAEAARASISDMYYFRCHHYRDHDYVGGAINLVPIEIARQLAHKVIAEIKSPYDAAFSIPALKAVFGIDGNQRLQSVAKQFVDVWVDTSDMRSVLKHHRFDKKIDWRHNRITLTAPRSYVAYTQMIDAQWQYGYDRGRLSILTSGKSSA